MCDKSQQHKNLESIIDRDNEYNEQQLLQQEKIKYLKPPPHDLQELDEEFNQQKWSQKKIKVSNYGDSNGNYDYFKIQITNIDNDQSQTQNQNITNYQNNTYIHGELGDGIFSKDIQQKIKQKQQNLSSFFTIKKKSEIDQNITPQQGPKILVSAWNVNNIENCIKSGEFEKYLKFQNPHILCLSETKVQSNNQCEEISKQIPKDYCYQAWNFSTTKRSGCGNGNRSQEGYSGTTIFSKTPPINVIFGMNIQEHDQEGRIITFEYKDFYLVSCYIPNAGKQLVKLEYRTKEWDVEFLKFINNLKLKKTTIVCGDLNVAHKNIDLSRANVYSEQFAGFTIQEKQNFTKLLENGWIDTFRYLQPEQIKYSYWKENGLNRKRNLGWRLDYFLIDQESVSAIQESKINNEIYGSDHCPVEIILDLGYIIG